MKSLLKKFHSEESGASLVEYGLLVALIAVGAIAAIRVLGVSITGIFTRIATGLDSAT